MSFFDDIGGILHDVQDTVHQGSDLYHEFAGTGTSPQAPPRPMQGPVVPSSIPAWVPWVIGGALIYALMRGVKTS